MLDIQSLLGWISPSHRTEAQHEAHDLALSKMGTFSILGRRRTLAPGDKILLTDSWSHPAVKSALGFAFPGWRQLSGSCCGVGFGNMAASLAFTDVILRNKPEAVIVPFWPMTYGRSRLDMGERGPGEGSLGSCIAQSAHEDGVISWTVPGLPQYYNNNGITLGSDDRSAQSMEMKWSDGTKIPSALLEEGRTHLIKTVAPVNSVDDLIQGIINGYPATGACMHFCNPGEASVTGGFLLGNYNGTGGHQMSYHGVAHDPNLGPLIWNQNTWGLNVYGDPDPAGGPPGGVWQKAANVDRMIKASGSEFYIYSQYDGYPAQNILDFWP